ncbi:MAG: nucleotide pyrophosphohydrolase [Gammaproteobacteria bacterium]|nr:nucleotide pyrophosphohydrolase [Gammaproteobacteria bacterium]
MSQIIDIAKIANDLQNFATERDWQQFHSPKNLAMALSCEASELLEIFLWLTEKESHDLITKPDTIEKIEHELADVMLYLIRLADLLKINLPNAIEKKFKLNQQKYPADQVKGSAKKYNEY